MGSLQLLLQPIIKRKSYHMKSVKHGLLLANKFEIQCIRLRFEKGSFEKGAWQIHYLEKLGIPCRYGLRVKEILFSFIKKETFLESDNPNLTQ